MPTQNDNLHRIDWFFTQRMFNRQYVPSLITAVVLSFGDIADSLVLGNRIGYIGLAALALTMPVSQVFNIIMNALGIGGCVRYANRMARGRKDQAVAGFQGVGCAAVRAAADGAVLNIYINAKLMKDEEKKQDYVQRAGHLTEEIRKKADKVYQEVLERL